jgi:hypothetical protein
VERGGCDEHCAQPFWCIYVGGRTYVTGGFNVEGSLSSVEKYTPSSDSWSNGAPLPYAKYQHAAVAVGSSIYVLGGVASNDARGGSLLSSVLKFDSTQDAWSEVEPMPAPRWLHAACAIGSDIYVLVLDREDQ